MRRKERRHARVLGGQHVRSGDASDRPLSAGQRRRLALARLVATRAPLWLLDEPTSGLDADNQMRLERIIAEHRAAGGRVVVASHTAICMDNAMVLGLDTFAPALGDADAF